MAKNPLSSDGSDSTMDRAFVGLAQAVIAERCLLFPEVTPSCLCRKNEYLWASARRIRLSCKSVPAATTIRSLR